MSSDDLAPTFAIAIGSQAIGEGVTQLVSEVSVEYIDGLMWMAMLKVDDKDLAVVNSKLFAWGNELDVWMGYGALLHHMGRFVVNKLESDFPGDGVATMDVKAYTADYRMSSGGPDGATRGRALGPREKAGLAGGKAGFKGPAALLATGQLAIVGNSKGKRPKRQKHERTFKDKRYDEAVADVASTYGFDIDADPSKMPEAALVQKADMTDYEFCRGLANLAGFLFWVDGEQDGVWTLHFRDPEKIYSVTAREPVQEKKYTFRYNAGDSSTLLSFRPTSVITQEKTKLRVCFKDPTSGKLIEKEIDEDGSTPDLDYQGDPGEKVAGAPDSGGAVRIFFGDFSVETVADKHFTSAAEAEQWAVQWFRRNRENFQQAQGSLIGVEDLRCFQIHALEGIGPYSGDWQFSRVRHVCSREDGYRIDFHARKVVR